MMIAKINIKILVTHTDQLVIIKPYKIHNTDVNKKLRIITVEISATERVFHILITCGIRDIVEVKAAKKPIICTSINIPPPVLSGSG